MEVKCVSCGREFTRSLSQVKGRVFCNIACRRSFHRPSAPCRGCGVALERDPKQPKRSYCTWACFKASRHVPSTCRICGKMFDSYASEQRKRDTNGHVACCSRDCRNVYTSLLLGGDGTWVRGGRYNAKRQRGPQWRRIRAQYLKHVGGTCEGCNAAPAIEVHHLFPVAGGGELLDFDNLMACCRDCHVNMHEQLRAGAFADSIQEARRATA